MKHDQELNSTPRERALHCDNELLYERIAEIEKERDKWKQEADAEIKVRAHVVKQRDDLRAKLAIATSALLDFAEAQRANMSQLMTATWAGMALEKIRGGE